MKKLIIISVVLALVAIATDANARKPKGTKKSDYVYQPADTAGLEKGLKIVNPSGWKPSWQEDKIDHLLPKAFTIDYQSMVVCHDVNHERVLKHVCCKSSDFSMKFDDLGKSHARGVRQMNRLQKEARKSGVSVGARLKINSMAHSHVRSIRDEATLLLLLADASK